MSRRPLSSRPGSFPRSPLHPPASLGSLLQPRSSRWASHLPCRRTAPLPATTTRSYFAGGMFGENPSAGLPPEGGPRRSPRRSDAGLIDFPSHPDSGIEPGLSQLRGRQEHGSYVPGRSHEQGPHRVAYR
ncbi:uncharacterized protein ACIQIH_003777 isoform 1-T1 [Cyanocitta cristata]